MQKNYIHTELVHNTRAAKVIVPFIREWFPMKNVLDVGCGTGTWLKVFQDHGLLDFLGLDGSYVDRNQLVISASNFKEVDLNRPFDLQRKFDIVLCLEVAEHLPDTSADDLVSSLCKHGEVIIFSAAIPGQGGQNHVNEQWPDYWQKKFEKHGFWFHDMIREKCWGNTDVDWWYRQNIFVVNKIVNNNPVLPLVHPDCFTQNIDSLQKLNSTIMSGDLGIRESFQILKRAIVNKIRVRR